MKLYKCVENNRQSNLFATMVDKTCNSKRKSNTAWIGHYYYFFFVFAKLP